MPVRTFADADERCRSAMESAEFRTIRDALKAVPADSWRDMVRRIAERQGSLNWEPLRAACASAGIDATTRVLERFLLLEAGYRNLGAIDALPLFEEVKGLLYDEFCFVAAPHRRWAHVLDPAQSGFVSMSRMMLLLRFPAGQLHWEIGGYPRSWLARTPATELPRLLSFLMFQMKGLTPYFATHMATRWTVPFTLTEKEDERSCYRMARSMELQPGIRGYFSASWLNDPDLPKTAPHLAWRQKKAGYGALLTTAGPAPVSSGFLEGSAERKRLYESGEWIPKNGVILWPRAKMIEWANGLQPA